MKVQQRRSGQQNKQVKRYKLRLNHRKMDVVFVADDADNCDDALVVSSPFLLLLLLLLLLSLRGRE